MVGGKQTYTAWETMTDHWDHKNVYPPYFYKYACRSAKCVILKLPSLLSQELASNVPPSARVFCSFTFGASILVWQEQNPQIGKFDAGAIPSRAFPSRTTLLVSVHKLPLARKNGKSAWVIRVTFATFIGQILM